MVWMATTPQCADEAFNITNGEFFRYENLWPVFADQFDMAPGGVETEGLTVFMAGREPVGDEIIAKHSLEPNPFARLANWAFANYAFSNDWDVMSDTTKCRKYGFLEFVDSEEMFLDHFAFLRQSRIVP
jgi:hypothetical protein